MTKQQKKLDELSDLLLEDSAYYRMFTDDDLLNATMIFSNVLFDLVYTGAMEISDKERLKLVFKTGKDLRNLIIKSTGLDVGGLVRLTK